MPPSGSSVGDEQGIAERLAEGQRAISIAEFFEKNKHMLGFDSEARALVTAVKEGVDNALDAGEEAGILPDILVDIQENGDYYTLVIEDNGPGITKEQVPKIFGKMLYGSRFHKRQQSLTPGQRILVDRDGRVETIPIDSFCDAYLPPAGESSVRIPHGVRVPAFNRETMEVTWQRVTHAIRHRTDETVFRIETDLGRTVEVTGHHSLFTVNDRGEPTEVEATELEPGDQLLAPRRLPSPEPTVNEVDLLKWVDEEIDIELRSITDGGDQSTTSLMVPVDETLIEYIASHLAEEANGWRAISPLGDQETRIADTESSVATLGTWQAAGEIGGDHIPQRPPESPLMLAVRSMCESTKAEKRIPEFVFHTDLELQQHLIERLFNTAGTRGDEHSHTTSSETLSRQLSTLLNMHGVMAHTEIVEGTAGNSGGSTQYRTTIPDDQRDHLSKQRFEPVNDTDVCLLEVTEIKEIDAPRYVYDISVPGETGVDENFVVCNDGALFAKNSRGQQGIGISAAVLYSQLTSGKAARITSRPMGSDTARYFEVIIDTDENEPDIKTERDTTWDRLHGTRIELELEANLRARQRLHDYIKQTAIVNPHARIELREPRLDEPKKFERATDQLPAETEEIRPHPHGVELGTLIKMLEATDSYSVSGFLQGEFTRVGKKSAEDIIAAFRDHHFGRELTWTPPGAIEGADLEGALIDAVTRKGKGPTEAFAGYVTSNINDLDRVSHQDVTTFVHQAADRVEEETDRRFGSTVRSNAIEAAWGVITGEDDGDRLASDLYRIIDEVTTSRKDDRTKHGLAERIVDRIRSADRPSHRFTHRELVDLIESGADATEQYADATIGETARENIIDALWTRMRRVEDDPPSVREVARERDLAAALLEGMREVDVMAPPTDCLAPITAELIEEGLRKEFNAELVEATTRDASVHGGDPFVVEAGVAYGGDLEAESQIDLMRFANRVPLVYQRGACATTDVVRQIDWRNYNLNQPGGSGMPSGALALVVHVASTNVPFTSESKDAIANIPAIEHEIELAIREVARTVKRHISQRKSLRKRREKEDVIARVLPEIATKVSAVVDRPRPDIDATLARIMNNVHVTRTTKSADGVTHVSLGIRNYNSTIADLEVTDIVSGEPVEVGDDVTVVEMDDDWYVRWKPRIEAGERSEITYTLPEGASSNLAVSGMPEEKLTIDQQ